jgi:integrase/recombinase XerD
LTSTIEGSCGVLCEFFDRYSLTIPRWLFTLTKQRSRAGNHTTHRDVTITVRGKGNHHELLPIPIDVGEMIVRYLRDGRRRIPPGCRALFVQVRAPEGPMSPAGVSDVVTRVSRRVGMPVIGAHQLRHGTATQLVRNGASWPEIAQLLRHRTVAVTVSYATVDATLMRELARPWPGAR